jgi:hypothetical protein
LALFFIGISVFEPKQAKIGFVFSNKQPRISTDFHGFLLVLHFAYCVSREKLTTNEHKLTLKDFTAENAETAE